MYLERLHIRRLKLLRDFRLDLRRPDGAPRMLTAIIGENGTAKTSLLQAIGLAAAGELQVNVLGKPVIGHLRDRRSDAQMHVRATFGFSERHRKLAQLHPTLGRPLQPGERLESTVTLRKSRRAPTIEASARYLSATGERIGKPGTDPLVEARKRGSHSWFVAGYGIERSLPQPNAEPRLEVPAIERLEPLFGRSGALTSLRFIDHFPGDKARAFAQLLRKTLTDVDALVPALKGMELRGRSGIRNSAQLIDADRFLLQMGAHQRKVPAVALSHGYQSTIAWLADLLGHVMFEADQPIDAHDIEGLVLIDEVDLYLHPTWQAGLLGALRHTFPKLQFIVTTHSPVVLSSLSPDEIVRVGQHPDTGDVEEFVHDPESGEFVPLSSLDERPPPSLDPRTMTGSEVYRDWFGLDRLTLNPHGDMLRRYEMLATDPLRTDDEEAELDELEARLAELKAGGVPSRVERRAT